MTAKTSGLGRGLGSLIPTRQEPAKAAEPAKPAAKPAAAAPAKPAPGADILQLPIKDIRANPEQPRTAFRHRELEDLTNSIKEHGIIQPLTVAACQDGSYELIAGERRLRAAKLLGLDKVPVMVRQGAKCGQQDKLVLALVENIQREDLNPLEEARAYERLTGEFGLTQEAVAKQVGKARATVANMLRLLDLPEPIQAAISTGAISAGSARAILAIKDDRGRLTFFRKLMKQGMTTREAEAGARRKGGRSRKDPAVAAAEEQLRGKLGTRVEIKKKGEKGSVVISFYSDEEYASLLKRLGR